MCLFFLCKQKTAYEMRISDWSSDVCSSDLVDSEVFNEWLQQTRAWYREQVEAILARLLALQEQAGAQESAIRTARRILALDPLREDMHRWLMSAFAAFGQRNSALAAYDACRSLLREALDVEPELDKTGRASVWNTDTNVHTLCRHLL